jgi:YYY domain-containing protein
VIHDRNLPIVGEGREEVINEFPAFSYLLADNHPHVMALPFALAAMSLALAVALSRMTPSTWHTMFYGVSVGALIFLNTWDAPVYLALLVGAEAMRAWHANGGRWRSSDTWTLAAFGALLAFVAVVAYLPFLVSFSSQLGGALPNLFYPTRFRQILLTFGALVPLAALFIGVEAWRGGRSLNWRAGLIGGLGTFGLILLAFMLLIVLGAISPAWRGSNQQTLIELGAPALQETLQRRLEYILTTVLLVAGLIVIFARLFSVDRKSVKTSDAGRIPYPIQTGVALMMAAAAIVLVLTPEYVYLRDGFSQRMNTIFKFYYQAWALLGIVGAYGLHSVLADLPLRLPARPIRGVIGAGALIAIAMGLVYPLTAIPERMFNETGRDSGFNTSPLTLDGAISLTSSGDYEALICLRDLTAGQTDVVVAEVTFGGGYDYFNGGIASGRVTGITGLPVVIGWQGHQRQWRGNTYNSAVGSRAQDIEQLYKDLRLDVVQEIIDRYSIDYIVFGPPERSRYGADGELKFLDSFETVCQSNETRVYRAIGQAGTLSAGGRP